MTRDFCLILAVMIIFAIWEVHSKVPNNLGRNPFLNFLFNEAVCCEKENNESCRREVNIYSYMVLFYRLLCV